MRNESGNVLVIILITIALFTALMFTFTKNSNTGSSDMLSESQAKLAATEILSHAQNVERAVNRILVKGESDQDICFSSDLWDSAFELAQYDHGDCTSDNEVFSSTGGGAKWIAPNPDWMDQTAGLADWGKTRWVYTGDDRIIDVGTNTRSELMVMLAPVKREVCEEINKAVGVQYDFNVNDYPCCGYDASLLFMGTSDRYDNDRTIGDQDSAYAGKLTGCGYGETPGYNYFWHVLIPR